MSIVTTKNARAGVSGVRDDVRLKHVNATCHRERPGISLHFTEFSAILITEYPLASAAEAGASINI